jgi:hypothetical protein
MYVQYCTIVKSPISLPHIQTKDLKLPGNIIIKAGNFVLSKAEYLDFADRAVVVFHAVKRLLRIFIPCTIGS